MVTAVDYHTAGEPFRIVSGGVPPLRGKRMLDKRRYALQHLDHIRELLVFEPRGHADMYGGFVTEPEDDGAQLGVVFFHNAGYSTACGHGTIALVTWAIDVALVPAAGASSEVIVDVPSGRLRTVATLRDGRVQSVRFRNVPSFVLLDHLPVTVAGRRVEVAVAFGGAFYAIVPAERFELPIEPAFVPRFIELGRDIKAAIEAERPIVHPLEPELEGVYGVMFTAGHRNVTVFADGEVDRSPCGSGTSARLAVLDARRELARGATLMHESVIGGRFKARVVGGEMVAGHPAVITDVEGSAHLTGYHQFVLQADDPIGLGFLIR
jgi:proline racemase